MSLPLTDTDVVYQKLIQHRMLGDIEGMWLMSGDKQLFAEGTDRGPGLDRVRSIVIDIAADFREVGRRVSKLAFAFDQLTLLVAYGGPYEVGVLILRREAIAKIDELLSRFLDGKLAVPIVCQPKPQGAIRLIDVSKTSDVLHLPSKVATRGKCQATVLWPKFRRRLVDILSQSLAPHRATQLIERYQWELPHGHLPPPSEYLEFVRGVLEPLVDQSTRDRLLEQAADIVEIMISES